MFTSIRTKLTLSHIIAVILVNLVLGITGYMGMLSILKARQQKELEIVAVHGASMLNNQLLQISKQFQRVAAAHEVAEYNRYYRETALKHYFNKFKKEFPLLSYVNEQGQEEIKTVQGVSSEKLINYADNFIFKEALANKNNVIHLTSNFSEELGEPAIKFALANYSYFGNKFAGVLIAEIPYSLLAQSVVSLSNLGDESFLLINDQINNFLIIKSGHIAEYNKSDKIEFASNPVGQNSLGDLHKSFFRTDILGVDSLASFARATELGWAVTAVLPYENFTQSLNRLRNLSLGLFVLMCALTGIISYLLATNITTALISLTQMVRLISKGNIKDKTLPHVNTGDEVGKLAKSFNRMLKSLQKTMVSRDYFDNIITSMSESLIVTSPDGTIITVNPLTTVLLEYETEELIGRNVSDILPDSSKFLSAFKDRVKPIEKLQNIKSVYITKEGRQIPILIAASPLKNNEGVLFLSIDVSTQHRIEKSLADSQAYLEALINAMHTGLVIIDPDTHTIIDVNPAAMKMMKADKKEEIVGKMCHKHICPKEEGDCPVTDKGETVNCSERQLLTVKGKTIPILKSVQRLSLSEHDILVETFADISELKKTQMELKESEAQLRELSITDELTGLFNRRGFFTMANEQFLLANRSKTPKRLFLLYANIDDVKLINDEFGHECGDKAILDTARLLEKVCRRSDIVSRLGGDEFAVLFIDSEEPSNIVERFIKDIERYNSKKDSRFTLSVSVGFAEYIKDEDEEESVEMLMSYAASLMLECKKKKKESREESS